MLEITPPYFIRKCNEMGGGGDDSQNHPHPVLRRGVGRERGWREIHESPPNPLF
jgi:hypothetical protein